jgi:hypothetical protein
VSLILLSHLGAKKKRRGEAAFFAK